MNNSTGLGLFFFFQPLKSTLALQWHKQNVPNSLQGQIHLAMSFQLKIIPLLWECLSPSRLIHRRGFQKQVCFLRPCLSVLVTGQVDTWSRLDPSDFSFVDLAVSF